LLPTPALPLFFLQVMKLTAQNFATVTATAASKQTFISSFTADVAKVLQISGSRVSVTSLTQGSVVVAYTIAEAPVASSEKSVGTISSYFSTTSGSLVAADFAVGTTTTNSLDAASIVVTSKFSCCGNTVDDAAKCPSVCPSNDGGGGSSNSTLIIGVIAAVAGLIVCGLIYYCFCRGQHHEADSPARPNEARQPGPGRPAPKGQGQVPLQPMQRLPQAPAQPMFVHNPSHAQNVLARYGPTAVSIPTVQMQSYQPQFAQSPLESQPPPYFYAVNPQVSGPARKTPPAAPRR
jgi:hypothetical protein